MIGRAELAALLPHEGNMCLLDAVVQWDATRIHCRSATHRDAANPLAQDGRIAAVCGVEYAAQAMAAHGALSGETGARPRGGYLASVRDVVCEIAWLDGLSGDLDIMAEQLHAEAGRVIYSFSLACDGQTILSGRAAVVLDGAVA